MTGTVDRQTVSPEDVTAFAQQGYLFLPDVFSEAEVAELSGAAKCEFERPGPQRTLETGSGRVRGVHGSHLHDGVFAKLVCDPRLLSLVERLLDDRVYVHQFKINAKHALGGEIWEWHQDFEFWHREDGMPEARALSVAVFLNEVTEFNGPLYLIPGSHDRRLPVTTSAENGWEATLTASLKYQLRTEDLETLCRERGIVAPHGDAGSVLIFHGNLVHGSPPNMSALDRALVLITYNAASNVPDDSEPRRPEFLAARDRRPLVANDGI